MVAALIVAGCGSGSGGGAKAGAVSPETVLRSAIVAIKTVHSYEIHETARDNKGPLTLSAEVGGPTDLEGTETRPSGTIAFIAVGQYSYVNATRSYWSAYPLTPAQLNLVSGHWLQFPTDASATLSKELQTAADPEQFARCWAYKAGSLSYVGRATINGVPTVELRDNGTAPGTAPGVVYVATTAPKVPIKAVITGPRKPGGPAVCGHSTTTSSVVTLGDFNRPIVVKPPAHALSVSSAALASSTG